jgi:integrase
LRWEENIDLAGKYLRIDASITKNHKEHRLPLSDYLYDLLSKRREKLKGKSEYVFPGHKKGSYLKEPKGVVKKVAEASGVKFMLHDLRRTFITFAEALDIPAYTLKKLINHSTRSDVTGGYIVIDMERLREPMQRITDYILEQAGVKEVDCVQVVA